ncbi:ABC transporter permease [bacterium]|nr:ABC transporter permease [bacterium]
MFENIGRQVVTQFTVLGSITELAFRFFRSIFSTYNFWKRVLFQLYALGIKSLPITIITSSFIGMAFTLQIVREFEKFGANYMLGGIVGLAVWRELGPLLTGVAVSARIGAAIASELGTMRVTEQIDALKALSQDPVKYLVVPRIVSVMIMMPLLVGVADVVGFMSGFAVGVPLGNLNPNAYFSSAEQMLGPFDIIGGLIKALIFGFIIGLISCFQGLQAKAGAKGVGESTTRAVVYSLISIFVMNYFLSYVLFQS